MILEVIVTTADPQGVVHIAPMGVRERDGAVLLAPFRPSRTLENVLATRAAVVNRTDDVRVFAGCVTGRRSWPTEPTACGVPRVAGALVHDELALERIDEDAERPRLFCRVTRSVQHGAFRGFNRAQAAVIEAAILASRLSMLPRERITTEMRYLAIAIDKTAGPKELEAWGWINAAIDTFYAGEPAANP